MLMREQIQAIEQLQKECEAYDTIQLKLNWSMLGNREETSKLDFF